MRKMYKGVQEELIRTFQRKPFSVPIKWIKTNQVLPVVHLMDTYEQVKMSEEKSFSLKVPVNIDFELPMSNSKLTYLCEWNPSSLGYLVIFMEMIFFTCFGLYLTMMINMAIGIYKFKMLNLILPIILISIGNYFGWKFMFWTLFFSKIVYDYLIFRMRKYFKINIE